MKLEKMKPQQSKDVSNLLAEYWKIRDMVLKKEWRNRDFGKEVLKHIIKMARKRKIRKIFALALPHTEKLYSSAGFEKEGILKNHYKKGENLAIMSLFL